MNDMRQMTALGRSIEDGSFAVIDREAGPHGFSPSEWQVVRRVIHATADFEMKDLMRLHPRAIEAGIAALRGGARILVDVKMIGAGLNEERLRAYGCRVDCYISDEDVIKTAKADNTTRAIEAMRKAHRLGALDGAVVALGNAPTALLEVVRLVREEKARPALVIGVPVGFVSAAESKEAALSLEDVPYIVVRGRKGGSPIAVAIIHALLMLSSDEQGKTALATNVVSTVGVVDSPLPVEHAVATSSPRRKHAVTVVGIGDDGCLSLSSRAANAVASAQVLVGGERQLAFFPQFQGERIVLRGAGATKVAPRSETGLGPALERVGELAQEQSVCVLASGDPLFFGIGALVVKRVGAEHVEFLPQPSSIQLAFARAKLKWDDAAFISVHGRSREGFLTRLKRHAKVACMTDGENTPQRLAALMLEHGETAWTARVCENLGGPDERVRAMSIEALAVCGDVSELNVLILQRNDPSWQPPPAISFLHEDAFAKRMPKKGLITKREARLLSLAQLAIRPTSVVWDVGAGSGSVSIEAALLAPEGRVYAVEVDPEGVAICRENAKAHAVDNVRVVEGLAPAALEGLEAPDAVFIGGSKGSMEEIIALALDRLKPGGRLVANAITFENVSEAYAAFRSRGILPDVTLLNVSRGEPLARYLRYEALNPIHIFAVSKPQSPTSRSTDEQPKTAGATS